MLLLSSLTRPASTAVDLWHCGSRRNEPPQRRRRRSLPNDLATLRFIAALPLACRAALIRLSFQIRKEYDEYDQWHGGRKSATGLSSAIGDAKSKG